MSGPDVGPWHTSKPSLKTTYVRDGGRRATVEQKSEEPFPALHNTGLLNHARVGGCGVEAIRIMRSSRWASRIIFMTVPATYAPVPSGDTGTPSSSSVSSPVMRTAMRTSRDFPSAMLGNKVFIPVEHEWHLDVRGCGGDDSCAVSRDRGPRER